MTYTTEFYPSADGIHQIFSQAWHPAGQPRGILQIVHGISEHSSRYEHFAAFLAELGFLVVAENLRLTKRTEAILPSERVGKPWWMISQNCTAAPPLNIPVCPISSWAIVWARS